MRVSVKTTGPQRVQIALPICTQCVPSFKNLSYLVWLFCYCFCFFTSGHKSDYASGRTMFDTEHMTHSTPDTVSD